MDSFDNCFTDFPLILLIVSPTLKIVLAAYPLSTIFDTVFDSKSKPNESFFFMIVMVMNDDCFGCFSSGTSSIRVESRPRGFVFGAKSKLDSGVGSRFFELSCLFSFRLDCKGFRRLMLALIGL